MAHFAPPSAVQWPVYGDPVCPLSDGPHRGRSTAVYRVPVCPGGDWLQPEISGSIAIAQYLRKECNGPLPDHLAGQNPE